MADPTVLKLSQVKATLELWSKAGEGVPDDVNTAITTLSDAIEALKNATVVVEDFSEERAPALSGTPSRSTLNKAHAFAFFLCAVLCILFCIFYPDERWIVPSRVANAISYIAASLKAIEMVAAYIPCKCCAKC